MSTVFINGIIGNPEQANSPSVRFNLTTNSEQNQVHGSVQITLGNPKIRPYSGNVEGTLNATSIGPYTKVVTLHGNIPANNPLNPGITAPFNAMMYLEADNRGEGSINFLDVHQERLPIEYREGNL